MSSTKNAIENIVHATLIAYCVMVIILAATLGYLKWNDSLNQKVVDSGYEIRSNQEFQQAIKYHGNDAWFCEWDSIVRSWVFYRTQNGEVKKCKAFKYLESERRDK